MRTTLRTAVLAAVASGSLLAACRGGTIPNQVLSKPVPASVPAPIVRTGEPWFYSASTQPQSFVVDQRAVLSILSDTGIRTDTVSSHTEVVFAAAPAATGLSGTVNVFAVASSGHSPAATPTALAIPFSFRADYSARGSQLAFSAPRDSSTCASAALAALQSLRDLWFRPPDTLHAGSTWADSSIYVVCRDGVPLHATARRAFRVSGVSERGGRRLLTIERISRTTLEGNGFQFGAAVSVSGSGSGELVYDLDPGSGEIVAAKGWSSLDFAFRTGSIRGQYVRQAVEIRISRN
jgi:hypothetical protein